MEPIHFPRIVLAGIIALSLHGKEKKGIPFFQLVYSTIQFNVPFTFGNKVNIEEGEFSCFTKGVMLWIIIVNANGFWKTNESIGVYGGQGNMLHDEHFLK
jgi:hypothetical protein